MLRAECLLLGAEGDELTKEERRCRGKGRAATLVSSWTSGVTKSSSSVLRADSVSGLKSAGAGGPTVASSRIESILMLIVLVGEVSVPLLAPS